MRKQTIEEVLASKQPLTTYFWSFIRGNLVDYSTGNPDINTTLNWGNSQAEWNNTILFPITELNNWIHKSTMAGGANLIIIPEKHKDIFQSLKNFQVFSFNQDRSMLQDCTYLGTLASKIFVFTTNDKNLDSDILVCRFSEDGVRYVNNVQTHAFNYVAQIKPTMDKDLLNKVHEFCLLKILNKE
jgi:hypothetical protein